MKRKIFKVLSLLAFLLIGAVCVLYWQRNSLLENYLRAKLTKVEAERNLSIDFQQVNLEGVRNLQLTGLCVMPSPGDTLVRLGKAEAKVSLMNLLRRSLVLNRLRLAEVDLRLVDTAGVRNFDVLLHSHKVAGDALADSLAVEPSAATKGGYAGRISKVLSLFFRVVPDRIHVENMNVSLQKDSTSLRAYLPELSIVDKNYSTQVLVDEDGDSQNFLLSGSFSNEDRSLDCRVSSSDGSQLRMPLLMAKFGVEVAFDSLCFRFREKADEEERLQMDGKLNFTHLCLKHPKLSDTLVSFPSGGIDYLLNVYSDEVKLDSASLVTVNQLQFSPYIRVAFRPDLKVRLSIHKDFFPSQQLFASLPDGLFRNLEGIVTKGELSYDLDFDLDMAEVDSLKFHSFMGKRDFKIERYGKTNFTLMNEPFVYSAYENGALVRSFEVGETNPDFRTIDQISPYLKSAVMYSEDGAFFGHKGFLETALTASIIQNIKEGRFARGGSTISMQLIKNLYLSRDKTLTRKLEEALIVWLVENNRLAPKSRMLEIYLNIIEWGPGIYGANEASRFYFDKDVSKLTPEEAIFMACVIPRPKKFYWMFDEHNELRSYVEGHYNIVGKRMLDNQIITESQYEKLKPSVKLTGAAKSYLRGSDKDEAADEAEEENSDSGWNLFRKTKELFKKIKN
ncbi:MAG: transglycosylase domain-containing protein [Paludibacteraceae bacterium]|nr:transglycosylase domain-containing protein [Paludibacteraceae bacterium]